MKSFVDFKTKLFRLLNVPKYMKRLKLDRKYETLDSKEIETTEITVDKESFKFVRAKTNLVIEELVDLQA